MVDKKPRVLIVDDEQTLCDLLYEELTDRHYLCTVARDGNEALTELAGQDFDIALLDIRLPSVSGMELLARIRESHPSTSAIMITAVANVCTAVQAMKLGASDYVVKPFDLEMLDTSMRTALYARERRSEGRNHKVLRCEGKSGDNMRALDAIAFGVEVRYESLLGYSKIVAQETMDIARQLEIDNNEIQRWAEARALGELRKERILKSSLKNWRGIHAPRSCWV